jgi:DNA polymerase-3 subunit alpha
VVLKGTTVPPLADLVKAHPAQLAAGEQGDLPLGLPVRLRIERASATAEIDLGERGKFWPSDEALAAWAALAPSGQVKIVYESA